MQSIPFSDFGVKWFSDIVGLVIKWFTKEIKTEYQSLTNSFFATPVPDGTGTEVVFGTPASTDEPWHSIYEGLVGGEVMLLSLLILFLCVQGRHFIRIFHVGSARQERQTTQYAWLGGIVIVGWYWVGVLVLYFTKGLTIAIIPDASEVGSALLQMLPVAAGNPILTLILAGVGASAILLLKAVFFIRDILLYIYLFGMPLGIAVVYGNVPVLSRIVKRLALQFVPLAILPLPAAVLFRGYALLFAGDPVITPAGAFLNYFTVISLPLLALYVTWKTFTYASPFVAGAIGTATRATATIGTIAALGYAGHTYAATTAARWGPKAGVGHAAVAGLTDDDSGAQPESQISQNNIATDGSGVVPPYRRTENDP